MSFENFEFPHTNFYNSDLRELLDMYKKLLKSYNGLVSDIEYLKNNTNEIIKEYLDADLSDYKAKLLREVEEEIQSLQDEVNERISILDKEMSNLDKNVNDRIDYLSQEYAEFKDIINTKVRSVELAISDIYLSFANYKDNMNLIFTTQLNLLKTYIDEHILSIDRLYVQNPFNGKMEDIQSVLDEMARYISQGYGLTAAEYDSLQLTASKYGALNLTALEYSFRGILIFYKEIFMKIRSPFTGRFISYDDIIYRLTDLHRGAYTAQEYDALNMTADDYDLEAWTAYDYDWTIHPIDFIGKLNELKRHLVNVVEIGTGGLTATQYQNLQQLHTLP